MRDASCSSGELLITSRAEGPGGILIQVEGRGVGLAPETAERIFEPFFTTKPQGIGMGLYMWELNGKPDYSMSGNGLLAGLVAITAPSGFVNASAACIIGLVAGLLVCLGCAFFENVLKIDDPVGAISVHGGQRPLGRPLRRVVCRWNEQLWRKLEWRHG